MSTARKIGSADFDGTADVTLAQMGVPNPNLLDNTDFINPVNQRRQASYTGGYCIDRWVVSNCVYTVATRKLMLTPTGTARAAANMQQAILWKRYFVEGDIITVSAKINGEIFSVSAAFPAPTGSAFPYAAVDISDDYELSLWRNTNQEHMSVVIQNKEGNSSQGTFTLDWIKLEKGSVATPYVPKGYGVELAECQRYYVRYSGTDASSNIAVGVGTATATIVYVPLILPVCMRSVPTVGGIYSLSDTSSSLPVTGTTVKNLCANSLYLSVSTSSTVERGKAYMLYVPSGGYFWVSAEL